MDKVKNADYVRRLMYLEWVILTLATHEYKGPLGIISYDTEIDLDIVKEHLNHPEILGYLEIRILLMVTICSIYDLEFPTASKKSKKRQFKEWFEEAVKKYEKEHNASNAIYDAEYAIKRNDFLSEFMNEFVAEREEKKEAP